ncbi:MAG: hypothetical protein KGL54_15100 [Sphingomonadales bacterium]|nr:hypothetical protein [Sphingomonadales bacterium]
MDQDTATTLFGDAYQRQVGQIVHAAVLGGGSADDFERAYQQFVGMRRFIAAVANSPAFDLASGKDLGRLNDLRRDERTRAAFLAAYRG